MAFLSSKFLTNVILVVSALSYAKCKFLIYHKMSSAGFCLAVFPEKNTFVAQLKASCQVDNEAWKWERMKAGLLRNVKYQRCLSATETGETISSRVELLSCDVHNELQKWKCTTDLALTLRRQNGEVVFLESRVDVTDWRADEGVAEVRPRSTGSKWLLYSRDATNVASSICDVALVDFKRETEIITGAGGNVVGQKCVFPFRRNGAESWSCFEDSQNRNICPTTGNFDEHPDKWGICPNNKRGVFSTWMPPSVCTRPCGGGRVRQQRFCLFEPCVGPREGGPQSTACNTRPCTGDQILTVGGDSQRFPAGLMPVSGDTVVGQCRFPFVADGEKRQTCITDHRRSRPWCSLTDNFDSHQKWGYCVDALRGVWGSWVEAGGCTRSCGGGNIMMSRRCRVPPCDGAETRVGGHCNMKSCFECFTDRGIAYRGTVNIANDGTPCQRWVIHSPHQHPKETQGLYPELEQNYCRNPGGIYGQPYCYRNSMRGPARMYCDIPRCGVDLEPSPIPYAIPIQVSANPSADKPCTFNYQYQGQWLSACKLVEDSNPGMEKCGTATGELAFCPSSFRGTWSKTYASYGECDRKCGGGTTVKFRKCLFPPCWGSALDVHSGEPCNTQPCIAEYPGSGDCFTGRGAMYNGMVSQTVTGKKCLPWNHATSFYKDLLNPQGLPRLTGNQCRNPSPDIYVGPWCYLPGGAWEYCDVAKCASSEGEIWGVPVTQAAGVKYRRCKLPRPDDVQKTEAGCTKLSGYSFSYCVAEDGKRRKRNAAQDADRAIREGEYLACPQVTRGTWSAWSRSSGCSVACGGGKTMRSRICLHPPCQHVEDKIGKACNTQKCSTCLIGTGDTYRGAASKTYLGTPCIAWSDMEDHKTTYKPSLKSELQANLCRNPGGHQKLPWCFTGMNGEMSYCEVAHCKDSHLHTIPYTIPEDNHPQSAQPCHFPYKYMGQYYFGCFLPSKTSVRYCSLNGSLYSEPSSWARCPMLYKGKWTAWNKTSTCSVVCGGGTTMWIRECLYAPCAGDRIKHEGACNTRPCSWEKTMRENVECFIDEGHAYTGDVAVTLTGLVCEDWSATTHPHHYESEEGGGVSLAGRKCRNPSPYGYRLAPWCFVKSDSRTWEYCDIVRCPTHKGGINTVGGPGNNRPCAFPFVSNSSYHRSCIRGTVPVHQDPLPPYNADLFFCATVPHADQVPTRRGDLNWGVCPNANAGVMGAMQVWEAASESELCTKLCGGGKVKLESVCRMPPCAHASHHETGEACNTQPCKECFEGDGTTFRGTHTPLFPDKSVCLEWSSVLVDGSREKEDYDRLDVLGDLRHNFCRNPYPKVHKQPFCHTAIEGQAQKVQLCNVPRCDPKGKVYGVTGDIENPSIECVFPFMYNFFMTQSCVQSRVDDSMICGSQTGMWDILYENLQVICDPNSAGTWGPWGSTGKCTSVCGGGKVVHKRECRYKPCEGKSVENFGTCNTFPCDPTKTCLDVSNRGEHYNGNVPSYSEGRDCVPWTNHLNYRQLVSEASDLDLSGSECRNPNGAKARPYCLTSAAQEFAFCSIPHCPGSAQGPILVPGADYKQRPRYNPCVFPFEYMGVVFHECTDASRIGKEEARWCGTATPLGPFDNEWGHCPESARGTWSSWLAAKQCTASCVKMATRSCLYPPCVGPNARVSVESCASCRLPAWGEFGIWSRCDPCVGFKIRIRTCQFGREKLASRYCAGSASESSSCDSNDHKRCSLLHVAGRLTQAEVDALTRSYVAYKGGGVESVFRPRATFSAIGVSTLFLFAVI